MHAVRIGKDDSLSPVDSSGKTWSDIHQFVRRQTQRVLYLGGWAGSGHVVENSEFDTLDIIRKMEEEGLTPSRIHPSRGQVRA